MAEKLSAKRKGARRSTGGMKDLPVSEKAAKKVKGGGDQINFGARTGSQNQHNETLVVDRD